MICKRCGKEMSSSVNCDGGYVCHSCCRSCFHYNNEISVLYCRESAFFNKLLNAGINITKDGRIYMKKDLYAVVIPPFKPAHIAKVKNNDNILELIHSKVSLKPKSIRCHISGNKFRLIVASKQDKMSTNEKAMSIADETVKGTAVVIINNYGSFIGMSKSAAQVIADEINRFNSEEMIGDVGA